MASTTSGIVTNRIRGIQPHEVVGLRDEYQRSEPDYDGSPQDDPLLHGKRSGNIVVEREICVVTTLYQVTETITRGIASTRRQLVRSGTTTHRSAPFR